MVGSPQGSDVDLSQVSTTLKQQGGGGVEVSDTADADGAFEFVSPPGLYEVVAEVSGSQCGSVSVNTAESHAQNVVLECRVK